MIAWDRIDTVLLDMDGTLLDLHYDNHFWHEYVPRCFAALHGVELTAARSELKGRYRKVEGTLDWYCVDYWSRELGLDIAQLKHDIAHLIAIHARVVDFLAAVRARGKHLLLVTNAHGKALALKLERTRIDIHFDAIVCAHDLGRPKEHAEFWERLQQRHSFAPARSALFDDSLPVLRAARTYGIGQLVAITRPDSTLPARDVTEFIAVEELARLIPR